MNATYSTTDLFIIILIMYSTVSELLYCNPRNHIPMLTIETVEYCRSLQSYVYSIHAPMMSIFGNICR